MKLSDKIEKKIQIGKLLDHVSGLIGELEATLKLTKAQRDRERLMDLLALNYDARSYLKKLEME